MSATHALTPDAIWHIFIDAAQGSIGRAVGVGNGAGGNRLKSGLGATTGKGPPVIAAFLGLVSWFGARLASAIDDND